MVYMKLVRDHIPCIISSEGKVVKHTRITDDEVLKGLYMNKLTEELSELGEVINSSDKTSILNEMVDMYEVLDALRVQLCIPPSIIDEARLEKKKIKGGFSNVFLMEVEE